MLTPEGVMTQEYQQFFNQFKEDMKVDVEGLLIRRQLSRLRWINPAWTAWSLAEVLDEKYMNGMRFEDLARREAQGDSPRFLVNTTLYNNGRRFVVSTLPREASDYDVFLDLNRIPGARKFDEESERLLRSRWDSLHSVTPEDIKLNTCRVRVAAAVVGSMSFPPVVGPISFRIEGQDQFWHVGDGGLADNTGAESLLMVFLKKLQEKKNPPHAHHFLRQLFPFFGRRRGTGPPGGRVQSVQLRLFAYSQHHGGARHGLPVLVSESRPATRAPTGSRSTRLGHASSYGRGMERRHE